MRKCFQVTICKSWFWVNKSKHFSKILSCNVPWQDWPNILNPFEKSAYQRWFAIWDITYWFSNAKPSWTCRIDGNITYLSFEVFSQEFYSHLNGCLNGISVLFTTKFDKTFRYGNCTFSLFPPSMKLIGFQNDFAAERWFLWIISHSQIFRTCWCLSTECDIPISLMQWIVGVLSDMTLMFYDLSLQMTLGLVKFPSAQGH